jgi:hypothetical protein
MPDLIRDPGSKAQNTFWIPAFAGMTEWRMRIKANTSITHFHHPKNISTQKSEELFF